MISAPKGIRRDIQRSNIYVDDDLEKRINEIIDKKVIEILSKKDLMNEIDDSVKTKIQLIFGQDVIVFSKDSV